MDKLKTIKTAIRIIRLKMHLPGIGVMTDCVLFCHDEKEGLPSLPGLIIVMAFH